VGVLPGVDIRAGHGSYVVASCAPGYEPVGEQYLKPFDPTWLPKKKKAEANGDGWAEVPEGKRNDVLAAMAGTMRAKGMAAEEIGRNLTALNRAWCNPPLDEDEVHAIARSIGRYTPEEDTEIILVGQTPQKPDIPTGLWGDELDAYAGKPVTWVVEDLIPEGLTILAGKPKIGKSWMSLGIAAEVAQGGTYMDRQCVQGTALYLALEDTLSRLQRRLRLVMGKVRFPKGLRVETIWAKAPDGLAAIHAFMKEHPDTKLVIIDTLAKVRHEGTDRQKGTYQDDYQALTGLKQLADHYGIGVVVVHHLRKGAAEDALDEVSGTTGLAGAADTILVLKAETLEGRGRDLEEDVAFDMMFDRETCRWRVLGEADFQITWDLAWWIMEHCKPGDRVPSEKQLRDVGLWSQDTLTEQLAALRSDPRFIKIQPTNPRSPLVVAPRAIGLLEMLDE
jgi:hypothetical protein